MRSLLERANAIPFSAIFGYPSDRPIQITCPFRERHSNEDRSKSARYYPDTNIIHCFAEGRRWRPVDLFLEKAQKGGNCVAREEAAKALLRKYGDYNEFRAARITQTLQARTKKKVASVSALLDSIDDLRVRGFVMKITEGTMKFDDMEWLNKEVKNYMEFLAEMEEKG